MPLASTVRVGALVPQQVLVDVDAIVLVEILGAPTAQQLLLARLGDDDVVPNDRAVRDPAGHSFGRVAAHYACGERGGGEGSEDGEGAH